MTDKGPPTLDSFQGAPGAAHDRALHMNDMRARRVEIPRAITWVTLVRFDRLLARPMWAMAKLVHHIVIPYLLHCAGRSRSRASAEGA